VKLFRPMQSQRPAAVRSTTIAVSSALVLAALGSVAFTIAFDDSLASGLMTFGMFGGLAALTAGVLAWEVASRRACPRCGTESSSPRTCAACGYDLRARPRFACSEGHRVAYEPGMCECGRRLLELRPVPLARHVARAFWLALAVFLVMLLLDALLAFGR
jgi:ribosomal protein L37E